MINDILSGNFSWIIALIAAITIHEFSHAFVADYLGDPTPRLMKRLTLNPLAHLDPIGTFFMLFTRFGWGKPVPIDALNLKNPRKDSALISFAGPASNLILALILSILIRFIPGLVLIYGLVLPIVFTNVGLAVFNLVPVGPLDGFKIVGGILPHQYAKQWYETERYGMILLLVMIVPWGNASLISNIIVPVVKIIIKLMLGVDI